MKKFDVHIHTNTDCNLQCRHCYNNSGIGPSILLQQDKLVELLNLLGHDSKIHMEGGEIMLHTSVLSVLCHLPGDILSNITITTNGTILLENPDIIQALQGIEHFRVSIEGHSQNIHGLIRNSVLEQVLYNAACYQKQGLPVVLRITLHQGNRDTLFREGIPALVDQGFRHFQIYELQRSGRGFTSQLAVDEDFGHILEDYAQMDGCMDVKLMLSERRQKEVLEKESILLQHGVEITFLKPENSLSISADGGISVCPWLEENTLGNVNTMTRHELLELLNQDIFIHTCGFCSKIMLQKESI